jgi:hypothetical protein
LAASSKVIVAAFVSGTDSELTIRRVRGTLSIATDQATADEQQIGSIGAGVFNTTAVTIGAASLPDPETDIGADIWSVYVPFIRKFEFITGAGFDPNLAMAYDLDSKAMRRMPTGYTFAFVLANAHATHGLLWAVNIRVLVSLTGK